MKYKKIILLSIPILFVIGSLFHMIYEWSGENLLIGFIAPINESIWEHTKLVLIPTFVYYLVVYILKKKNLNKNKWFTSCLLAVVSSIIAIPFIFYFYTGAFGVESLIFDIIILLIAITIGSLLAIHFYKYAKKSLPAIVSILVIILIIVIYIIFTLNPPNLPIFTI